ncbi:MAG TPA: cell division protein ZapA [Gemmatimonadaceae bacterium]|nr:cell division protein ZapA [Gemmatimonadaceae bacterium]
MNPPKSVVKVSILDEEFTIRSEATPEHTVAVAEHVDGIMRHIMGAGATGEVRKAAILAALQIADELLQSRSTAEELTTAMRGLSSEVRPWLPPKKRHD